jgi:hypothetical protein
MAKKLSRKKRLAQRDRERSRRENSLLQSNRISRRLAFEVTNQLVFARLETERLKRELAKSVASLETMRRRAEDAERKFRENVIFLLTGDVPKEPTLWGGRYMLDLSYSFWPVRAIRKIENGPREARGAMMLDCEHAVRGFLRELELQLYPVLKQFIEQRYPSDPFRQAESGPCNSNANRG